MEYGTDNTIKLGLMPPLTGMVAIYGQEILNAATVACQEINSSGGLLGKKLELIIEDDGSLPDTAVPAANRLITQHQCVAMIGNLLSNSRIAVATQVAEPRHVPYLNFSFYEGSISGRYFFHFAALPNQQIDKMIPYMAEHFGMKMFFAGNNYEWPRGSIDAAKRSLQKIGGDIVGEEYLSIGVKLAEIDQLLAKLVCSGADVFVPYFAGNDQIALLTRFTNLGLKNRMAVVMGHYDEMMVSYLPAKVREGFYSSNTYFMSIDTPMNQAYKQRLSQLNAINGIWPKGNGILTNFGEGTYLCVHAFAKAVTEAGTTEAEALVQALEHIHIDGPQGHVVMDPKTHHATVNTYLSRCNKDGSFSIIEKFGQIAPEIPQRYQGSPDDSKGTLEKVAHIAAQELIANRHEAKAHKILSAVDMGIIATDEQGIITEANPSASKLFAYPAEEMLGMSIHMLLPPHLRKHHADMVRGFIHSSEMTKPMTGRSVIGYRKDGSFFPLEASIAKIYDDNAWSLVVTLHDISDRKQAEEELLWKATHDQLTGLSNRALVRERLHSALERSKRSDSRIALLFIDLDGFKLINDTYGHEAGDCVLKETANRLINEVRPGDTVARLAGDEFVILCEQLEQPMMITALAERIIQMLRQEIRYKEQALSVTASIGIVVGHGSSHTPDDMLRFADSAMYEVKERGRNGWSFFNQQLDEKVRRRLNITQGLRSAIKNKEFYCLYQPIVNTSNKHIAGAELLLRWNSPMGAISPAEFIAIAEMTGSIVNIGDWVFLQACQTEVSWRQRWGINKGPSYISVNVSTRQLSESNLSHKFACMLSETGADPSRILLEITETSLMSDVSTNLRVLQELVALGFRIAVDDFGTGYSSLAQLTRMPVSVLKIDKAFIDGLKDQSESLTVVKVIISLGQALNLKLIAEGVEEEAQFDELKLNNCNYIQGYLFHKPLHAKQFIAAVDNENCTCAA